MHAVAYSLLLLNTDLHVADMRTNLRMTRAQFVENTMAAIRAQTEDDRAINTGLLFGGRTEEIDDGNVFGGEASKSHKSLDRVRDEEFVIRPKRSGSIQSWKSSTDPFSPGTNNSNPSPARSIKSPSFDLSPVRKLTKHVLSNDTVSSGRLRDIDLEFTLKVSYLIPLSEMRI